MEENVCHFIPFRKDTHSINAINFVFETKPMRYEGLKPESLYKMYYVCSGEGCIHIPGKEIPLQRGDVFFTFPGAPFAIESIKDFTYMYISFLGFRGNLMMESLNINTNNFLFHNAEEVESFWRKGIRTNSKVVLWISESILLYTFSFLANRLLPDDDEPQQRRSVILIKKYLDEHFADHNFSLEKIGRELHYNKKYISYVFKKHFGTSVIEYLNTVRIQNACTLIQQGTTSVGDIADKCGFSDAQYFSKTFKNKTGLAPTQYINSAMS